MGIKFGYMMSFKRHLLAYINDSSVIVANEKITPFSSIVSLFMALLELSCGKISYIDEYFYLAY